MKEKFLTVGRITVALDQVIAIIPQQDKNAILPKYGIVLPHGQIVKLDDEESAAIRDWQKNQTTVVQKPSNLVT